MFGNLCMGKHFLPMENVLLDLKTKAGLLVLINGFQPTQPLINFSLFFLLFHTFNLKT